MPWHRVTRRRQAQLAYDDTITWHDVEGCQRRFPFMEAASPRCMLQKVGREYLSDARERQVLYEARLGTVVVDDVELAAVTFWLPFGRRVQSPIYRHLALRLHRLADLDARLQRARFQRYYEDGDEPVADDERGEIEGACDRADAFSYALSLWLDEHWTLALTIEQLGEPDDVDARVLATLVDELEPTGARPMALTMHELDDFDATISQLPFFEMTMRAPVDDDDDDTTKVVVERLFRTAMPTRVKDLDVVKAMQAAPTDMVTLVVVASLLGVYRHVHVRPPPDVRRELYRRFLFQLNDRVRDLVEQHRASRGRPRAFDDMRRSRVGELIDAALKDSRTAKANEAQVRALAACVREHLIFALGERLRDMRRVLCECARWRLYERTLIEQMDRLRHVGRSALTMEASPLDALLPLYQHEKMPFIDAVLRETKKFLYGNKSVTDLVHTDAAAAADDADVDEFDIGTKRECDAIFTLDMQTTLECMIDRLDIRRPIRVVARMPESLGEARAMMCERNELPLRALHASVDVLKQWRLAEDNYHANPKFPRTAGFVRYVASTSMYQLQLVHAVAQTLVDRRMVRTQLLPEGLYEQQLRALARRFNLSKVIDSQHAQVAFVCMHCRAFCGKLCDRDANPMAAIPPPPGLGNEKVTFADNCVELAGARHLLQRGNLIPYDALVDVARQHRTLYDYYAWEIGQGERQTVPRDVRLFDVDSLDEARAWYAELLPEPNLRALYAAQPAVPAAVPTSSRSTTVRVGGQNMDADFRRQWRKRMLESSERAFVVGVRSDDRREESTIHVCASIKVKTYKRNLMKTERDKMSTEDGITEADRIERRVKLNLRTQRNIRTYFDHTLCARSRCVQVSMLGRILYLDKLVVVACCLCLRYTRWSNAYRPGSTIVCPACKMYVEKVGHGHLPSETSVSTSTHSLVACIQCQRRRRADDLEAYYRFQVWNDLAVGNEDYMMIHFCPTHAKHKMWMKNVPNVHSLSTVLHGIRTHWKTTANWQYNFNYLNAMMGERVMADEQRLLKMAMKKARKKLGSDVMDGDGEMENDDDNDDDDDDNDDDDDDDDDVVVPPSGHRMPAPARALMT